MSNNNAYRSIMGLNTIPPHYDLEQSQSQAGGPSLDMDPDLELFTNQDFVHWDDGEAITDPAASIMGNDQAVGLGASDFAFSDFSGTHFPNLSNVGSDTGSNSLPAHRPQQAFGRQHRQQPHNISSTPSVTSLDPFRSQKTSPTVNDQSSPSPSSPSGLKRKASEAGSLIDENDNVRISAEEDKRRRNTAASARFRVKKKQREQLIEKTAQEMTDRVKDLENKVCDLEKENRLLKGLLTEKNHGVAEDTVGVKTEGETR